MPDAEPQVAATPPLVPSRPLRLLVVANLVVALLALYLFSEIAEDLSTQSTHRFDLAVRAWVHQFASPGITHLMFFMSQMGYLGLIALLVASLVTFALLRWRRAFLWMVVAMAGALALETVLKLAFHRSRPTPFFGAAPLTFSFPSGHALSSFCFYGVLAGLLSARTRSLPLRILIWTLASTLILMIGLSRIYLGVHWPSDVIAGYLAATVWVGTIIAVDHARKFRRSHLRSNPS